METEAKHYKFINSKTGNAIYYYTLKGQYPTEKVRQQLDVIRAEVAVSNGVYLDTIYWEEVRETE